MKIRIIEPKQKTQVVKKKVCAYVRVSTDTEQQSDSFENQVQYYESKISANPEYQYVGVFADRGISGTSDKRPEFQKMLELCRNGEIDIILTKSISRFARNTTIMLTLIRELKLLNVEVRFEKENINTLSGDGEFMLTVLSSFAQEESKSVSDNLKWRVKKKFEQGELIINTNRFLGYKKDRYGELAIEPKEAKIVKRIFEDYLSGKGSFTIAKELNAERVKTISGKRWHSSSILLILRNEKYKGDAILQKYYTPNHLAKQTKRNQGELDSYYIEDNHPPIISREIWESVQIEIKSRACKKGNVEGDRKKYNSHYPLTGMLYCSKCGSTLQRRIWNSNSKSRKVMWQCRNYIKNGKSACTGTAIEEAIINKRNITKETIVWEEGKCGEKYYRYTSKNGEQQSESIARNTQKENGSLLPSVDRPIRTTIKL